MARWRRSIYSRVVLIATLVVTMLLLSVPATAGVIANEHTTFTVTNVNPCAVGDGPVLLTFDEHDVVQQLADGTIVVRSNFHGTGTSANGVAYVANRHEVTTIVGGRSSGTFRVIRATKGPGDNVQI